MTTPPIADPPRRIAFFTAMVIRNSIPGTQASSLWLLLLLLPMSLMLFIGFGLLDTESNGLLARAGGVLLTAGGGLLLYRILSRLIKNQREGARYVKLIEEGTAVYGTLLGTEEEFSEWSAPAAPRREEEQVASSQNPSIYFDEDYLFEFQTLAGSTHRVKGRLEPFERVKIDHGAQPLILYRPDDPSQAVVYQSIKNAPEILPDGQFASLPLVKSFTLVLPALVMIPFTIIPAGLLLILTLKAILSIVNLLVGLG